MKPNIQMAPGHKPDFNKQIDDDLDAPIKLSLNDPPKPEVTGKKPNIMTYKVMDNIFLGLILLTQIVMVWLLLRHL